ncbi:RNA-directed DNA polymerase, eukaryota [Tanacetum coccineum]
MQAMVFKVDFAKAYDSVRWDYLDDVLRSFGFGFKWRSWINRSLVSGMASILINGSPTSEFQFHCGLKQGDPLAPYLFILIMESLHLSFSRVVDAGIFKGIKIDNSVTISHLFYADDAVFIGEWSDDNLTRIMHVLHSAKNLGCSVMKTPFKYLGVMVGGNMSKIKAWDDTIGKLNSRLSKWKLKTLSIGGRLTNFFNGIQGDEKKITWVKWSKEVCLSFNSADDGSELFGKLTVVLMITMVLDLISHCKKRVGNGLLTRFWSDIWLGDNQLRYLFPRIYALELNKDCSVAVKMLYSVDHSLRRSVRGGAEAHQLDQLQGLIGSVVLANSSDRWYWDLNGSGSFCVKDVRNLLDEFFLPKDVNATRWIKYIPIKINVFAWKVYLDRLPTKLNLIRRGIQVLSASCPICNSAHEDLSHLLFSCDLATDVMQHVCRWWDVVWTSFGSYSEWLAWFKSIRMGSKSKSMLEGVFYVSWWCLWNFRNQLFFAPQKPRKEVIFDDIVARSFTLRLARCNGTFSWESWF